MKNNLRILYFFVVILLFILYFKYENKNFITKSNIYRTSFLWQVMDSKTPLKDLTILAEQGIQNLDIIEYLYSNSGSGLYENINFDLNYDKTNNILNIKRIYFQGIGTKETVCWKYLEEFSIPLNNFQNKFLYNNKNEKSTCIDDYKKNNALSLILDIDDNGYLIKKELKGTTLQKKDSFKNILIYFYYNNSLLKFSNTQTKYNLYVEKQKNKEIYKDEKGNIIKIYEALLSFSEKYKQDLIQKIIVKDNKNNILETIIFEYD